MRGPSQGAAASGAHGLPPNLAPFIGRSAELKELSDRLRTSRLVTILGPGGVGKTRLAGEAARVACPDFADGSWFVELANLDDPEAVPEAVADALGIRLAADVGVEDLLARRQLLLVLDNCEHLVPGVARFCGSLLELADDVTVLATSRTPLGLPGETRFRLAGLGVHASGPGHALADAVELLADRARRADRNFVLADASADACEELVARLDGLPLAIELAAVRIESLGLVPLLRRLDDRLSLLAVEGTPTDARQHSLEATVDWSYQLLGEPERAAFRTLSAFPGPFTLDAAEAVIGTDAASVVPRLVDASLLVPPSIGTDGRPRYQMLETLRLFGADRRVEAGEDAATRAAIARCARDVAAAIGRALRHPDSELEGIRSLAAEGSLLEWGSAWSLEHAPVSALEIAVALAPGWFIGGRWLGGHSALAAALERAGDAGTSDEVQFWLGMLTIGVDASRSLEHFSKVLDGGGRSTPSVAAARSLAWRAGCHCLLGRVDDAAADAQRALELSRAMGDPAAEASAWYWLSSVAKFRNKNEDATTHMRRAWEVAASPGWIRRQAGMHLAECLADDGDLAEARRLCDVIRALAREHDALYDLGDSLCVAAGIELRAGAPDRAGAHLGEALDLYARTGAMVLLFNCLGLSIEVCAATGRFADLLVLQAAWSAAGIDEWPDATRARADAARSARRAVGASRAAAAEALGSGMGHQAAADFAAAALRADPPTGDAGPGDLPLSPRERELVGLVAQGCTNADIASRLHISVRTVGSHLDRIRDKTGCRRRVDLTRLAVRFGLG